MRKAKPNLTTGFHTADQIVRVRMSTGITVIDELLGGGIESGLIHLFYGDKSLYSDILKIAVHAQIPEDRGGLGSPTIIIDSANILKIEELTDNSFEFELEPEEVMDSIYITRAFSSSQTYDLIMNHLDGFFKRVPARVLMVTGLPDLYIKEGITSEGTQQITHMITKLMTFTLGRRIFTIVTAPLSKKSQFLPAGGTALASCTQVHIHVNERRSYVRYTLAKHPSLQVRRTSRSKMADFGTTPPLSYFLKPEDQ